MPSDPPRPDQEKSGRVLVRMPVSLHKHLFESALAEGVSMNQFVCGLLAVAVDWRSEYRANAGRPVAEIRHDIAWEMYRDRMRQEAADVPR